jgi:transcriptional regulator with XRE-family HTH domain
VTLAPTRDDSAEVADEFATTAASSSARSRLPGLGTSSRGQKSPAGAARLFVGGLALSSVLTGTSTTAPSREWPVRYIGSWTSTARTVKDPTWPDSPGVDTSTSRLPSQSAVEQPAWARGSAPAGGGDAYRRTQDAEIRWLHEASGLTWEQLGRTFGVSRRAVHMWANGGRMNSANAETLFELVALVRELPGATPEERRAALLAPGADGRSIIDRLRARHASDARDVSGMPFRPDELLGARHGDVAVE